uniref:DUF5641 domain-containing protein n=1 Tax=Anopheles funestus TaxID=62324 RepID=A0A182S0G2_ANOFN
MAGSNKVNQEPFTRARSTEVISSLPNAKVVWDEHSRSFHHVMEEINAAPEPRKPESDVVQRLKSVLETFVQRINRDNNPQGARRENGTTSSSIAVQDGTLNVSQSQVLARRSVMRLQQALKGDALKAVQGRLRNAANLKEVMEELKTSFGRPEIIVQTVLSQIRRQVPPKTEKLESLIQFAISVDEMCATVRTNGVEDRYDGPLLDELIGCLPPMVKLMWGLHRITLSKVNLAAFGKWMQTIKQAAQSVTNPAAHSDRNNKYFHTHVTNSPSQNTTEAKCACENGCAQLYECDSYWQKSIADRWNIVKKNYLCKRCLRKHPALCKETSACGKEGCTAKLHPSLHNKAECLEHRIAKDEKPRMMMEQVLKDHIEKGYVRKRKRVASYLPTLTRRSKWFQPQLPLREGDRVLLVDDALPRGCWPMLRISLLPSKDGVVRSVHVQLGTRKILERPAVKISCVNVEPHGGV